MSEAPRDAAKAAGDAAFKSGNFEDAIRHYSEGISLDASSAVLYSNRSAAYLKISQTENALKDAKKCVNLGTMGVKGLSRLAAALQAMKAYGEAKRVWGGILGEDPNHAVAKKGVRDCEAVIRQHLASDRLFTKEDAYELFAWEPSDENFDSIFFNEFLSTFMPVPGKPNPSPDAASTCSLRVTCRVSQRIPISPSELVPKIETNNNVRIPKGAFDRMVNDSDFNRQMSNYAIAAFFNTAYAMLVNPECSNCGCASTQKTKAVKCEAYPNAMHLTVEPVYFVCQSPVCMAAAAKAKEWGTREISSRLANEIRQEYKAPSAAPPTAPPTMSESDEMRLAAQQIMAWRGRIQHEPLFPSRTTDTEARDFDRSIEMFRAGIRAARAGDLIIGEKKIAAAYLLDRRCMRAYVPVLPPDDQLAADCLLDIKLLQKLFLRPDGDEAAMAILHIITGIYGQGYKENQEWLVNGLKSTKDLLNTLEANPALERNSDVLEGCLTRPLLHFRRADIFYALNNFKKAGKEMTAALKIDPKLTLVRAERAKTWSQMAVKDLTEDADKLLHEWRTVVEESHPDSRQLREAYAWMSVILLENPQLGTYEEALELSNKMEENSKWQEELYGGIGETMGDFAPTRKMVHEKFALTEADIRERKFLDMVPRHLLKRVPPANAGSGADASGRVKYLCMQCSKGEHQEGVKLSKCLGCKKVSYCSKECQRADWKNHKKACKLYKNM